MTGFIVFACIFAPIVVLCALGLFFIKSSLARPLHRLSIPFALILTLVVIFIFLLIDIGDLLSGSLIALVSLSSALAFLLFGHVISLCRRRLKRAYLALERGHARVRRRHAPRWFFHLVFLLLDLLGAIFAGIAAGFAFLVSLGSGIMLICTLILFAVPQCVARLDRYRAWNFSHRALALNLTLSLAFFPLSALLAYFLAINMLGLFGVLLSFSVGYLVYLFAWHAFFLLRAHLKTNLR